MTVEPTVDHPPGPVAARFRPVTGAGPARPAWGEPTPTRTVQPTAGASTPAGTDVLLAGFNHVAVLTKDPERLHAFYREVFYATVFARTGQGDVRLSLIDIGPSARLNVFHVAGNEEADRQSPMFGRGRIDHLGLEAASREAFDVLRDRLVARGASDGFVTDFGTDLSLFFRDPDGLECEVCLRKPDATPDDLRPPGTPAAGYPTESTP